MRLSARTTLARILAAQQRFEKARLLLQAVSSEARRRSLLGHRLEAIELGTVPRFSAQDSIRVVIPPDHSWVFPQGG